MQRLGCEASRAPSALTVYGWKQNLTILRDERGLQVLTFCIYDILLVIALVYLMPGSVGT